METAVRAALGKRRFFGLLLALLGLLVVFLVEQLLQPSYWVKTAWKAGAFLGAIALYGAISKQSLREIIGLHKITRARELLLGMLFFFGGIVLLFVCFRGQLDLNGIKQSLTQKEKLTRQNCLLVFGYIIVCNAFLEEAFFRGFLFRLFAKKKTGALVSAVLFSLYHIGIFITWFNPFLFVLCVLGLVAVGLFLQWIAARYQSIAASYLIHACANLGINTIGALLIFGLLP